MIDLNKILFISLSLPYQYGIPFAIAFISLHSSANAPHLKITLMGTAVKKNI